MDSANNDVIEIHLPVGNSYLPLLSIPRSDIERLSNRPFRWLLFVVFAISGAHGHLSETPHGGPVDPDGTSLGRNWYYYNPSGEYVFVDCDGLNERMTSSSVTARGANFRDEALERDEVCVVTQEEAIECDAAHLIPRRKGKKYIRKVLQNRSRCYPGLRDSPALRIDDHVNGVLLRKDLHAKLHEGKIAFIKTPNFALEPADIPRFIRGPERTDHIILQRLQYAGRFDKAAIERTLDSVIPEERPAVAFQLGSSVDALFPGAAVNPSSPSIDSRSPTIQSSRSLAFEGSQSPPVEHSGLSGLDIDGVLSGNASREPSSESSVLQLEAPPSIILDFMYGVAAYRQWGRKDILDIMRKYCEEHYNSSPQAAESSDDDCPPPRQRARRPGLRSSTKREETTLGKTMTEMGLVLEFLSGISPQEAAKRREKEREEEERAEREASQSKVLEWLHVCSSD